jgi:hypothetical protein
MHKLAKFLTSHPYWCAGVHSGESHVSAPLTAWNAADVAVRAYIEQPPAGELAPTIVVEREEAGETVTMRLDAGPAAAVHAALSVLLTQCGGAR